MKNFRILFVQFSCMLLFVLNGCSSGNENVPQEEKKSTAPSYKMHTVEIKQMKFVPEEIVVKKGDRIVFVNRDLVEHDVTEESKKEWSSSTLPTEKFWTLVATSSQNYYCSLHPVMKGKIIVE